jgi:nucleotide-binding universal stress UspA family protein
VKIIVWLTGSTWPACVDAASDYPEAEIVLLHVIDPDSVEAAEAARAGLLGRGIPAAAPLAHRTLVEAQAAVLDAAEARLGRPVRRAARTGRVEREVVDASADADMLVLARDGDHTRLGPRSLGRATRFVLDHAPCRVLLVWPDEPPSLATLPAPPHRPPDTGPPGPHPSSPAPPHRPPDTGPPGPHHPFSPHADRAAEDRTAARQFTRG